MASFGWNRPEWWESVSSGSPRDRLDVTALAYSLRAADADAVVAFAAIDRALPAKRRNCLT